MVKLLVRWLRRICNDFTRVLRYCVEYCDINHFEVKDIENCPNKGIFID